MDNVFIYDTYRRSAAGFSNCPESLWYGPDAPKVRCNIIAGRNTVSYRQAFLDDTWFYLLLIHRITGSGASFENDHGWRNTILPHLCEKAAGSGGKANLYISELIREYDRPMFTSIGNQIPPFNKPADPLYATGGREYLCELAPQVAVDTCQFLKYGDGSPVGITTVVDRVLKWHRDHGLKQYKFVLTAWVNDLAEYFGYLVEKNSNVYHGKNAIKSIELIFQRSHSTRQEWYDAATRFFADKTVTCPMDVEDSFCDAERHRLQYIAKKNYDHLCRHEIWNSSSLKWDEGRQPHIPVDRCPCPLCY